MPPDTYVQAVLVAGIAGAGLVLTAYTLAISRANEILTNRSELWLNVLDEYRKGAGQVSSKTTKERSEQVNKLKEKLDELQGLPSYMNWMVLASFVGYSLASLFSFLWLLSPSSDSFGFAINIAFTVATVVFLFVGIRIIHDINSALEKRYQELKQAGERGLEEVRMAAIDAVDGY